MKYDQIYKNQAVTEKEPNKLLQIIWQKVKTGGEFLDLGCGDGHDLIFMAKQGFNVTAIDQSNIAVANIEKYLEKYEYLMSKIKLFCQDIKDFEINKNKYQIINAFNSLQFLEKNEGLALIKKIKEGLMVGGFAVLAGFTVNDPLYQNPVNQKRCFFTPNELKDLFFDFEVIFYEEIEVTDLGHTGYQQPHQHQMVRLVARKSE